MKKIELLSDKIGQVKKGKKAKLKDVAAVTKYDEIIERLGQVSCKINPVEIVTPANISVVKTRWLEKAAEGQFEDPVFKYDRAALSQIASKNASIYSIIADLPRAEGPAEELISSLIIRRSCELYDSIELAEAILNGDDRHAREVSIRKYGQPEQWVIEPAITFIADQKNGNGYDTINDPQFSYNDQLRMNTRSLSAHHLKEMVEDALYVYGWQNDWTVLLDERAQAIDVRDKSSRGPIIVIPKNSVYHPLRAVELIGHEIECHVRQSMNGLKALKTLAGGALKPDNETLYEGTAVQFEQAFKLKTVGRAVHAPMANRYIAINRALHGQSFSMIAEWAYNEATKNRETKEQALNTAFSTAYRSLRGATDAHNNEGYAFCKDLAYLSGYYHARNLKAHKLDFWLDLGVLSPDDLVFVASKLKFTEKEIPFPRQNLAEKLLENVL